MTAAPSRARFPWADAMRVGLGVLRLSPRDFWSMSLREFQAACEGLFGRSVGPPPRQRLDELMKLFPDEPR
jgi:uncharacterized phage protein (TIGR02216 family)